MYIVVKYVPVMQETWVRSLGQEDPLEEGIAIHSSILVWRIPIDREAWWATVCRVAQSQTQLSDQAQPSTNTSFHYSKHKICLTCWKHMQNCILYT